jgi:hypothetical protein
MGRKSITEIAPTRREFNVIIGFFSERGATNMSGVVMSAQNPGRGGRIVPQLF